MEGSTAQRPDLNWSQMHETVVMLELAAKQIESAMKEGNVAVESLAHSFTELAESLNQICAGFDLIENEHTDLKSVAVNASGLIQKAVVAFQFYDKLAQRLSHVSAGLGDLSALVSDKSRLFSPQAWVDLQEKIRQKYSTREELVMFEAVIHGMSVTEAIEKFKPASTTDNIELF